MSTSFFLLNMLSMYILKISLGVRDAAWHDKERINSSFLECFVLIKVRKKWRNKNAWQML